MENEFELSTDYVGIKRVSAVPMTAEEAQDNNYKIGELPKETEGMEVTYADGYKSWCHKDVFDAANSPATGVKIDTSVFKKGDTVPFGIAMEVIKSGRLATPIVEDNYYIERADEKATSFQIVRQEKNSDELLVGINWKPGVAEMLADWILLD